MFKSILLKFSLVLLGVLITAFFVFGVWINSLVRNREIDRSTTVVARDIQAHARLLLEPESFVFGSEQASRERFMPFFDAIRTSDIVRIKVWDVDSRVIFSDEESIIGKYFPEDKGLKIALDDHTEAVIQKPIEPENVGESGYEQLLEVYVPVYFENNSRPAGIVEVYFNLNEINNILSEISKVVFITMILVFTSLFVMVGLVFWFLVRRRLTLLVEAVHEVAGGNLEVRVAVNGRDEIGELAAAFNFMTAKLKEFYEGMERKVLDRTIELEKDNKEMIGRELKMVELKKEIDELKKAAQDSNVNHKNV